MDSSPRSIEYASQVAAAECLVIDYHNRDYLEFETEERFDLALMIVCDFCALGPEQRKKLPARFYTILKPGGSILMDVVSLKTLDKTTFFEAGRTRTVYNWRQCFSPESLAGRICGRRV